MIPPSHSTSPFPIVQCQPMQHNNKNSELYLHDCNITALQERQTHDNYSNLVIHADNSERAPRSIIRYCQQNDFTVSPKTTLQKDPRVETSHWICVYFSASGKVNWSLFICAYLATVFFGWNRHSSRDLEPGAFPVWRRTEADTKKKWTAGVTDNGRYSQPSTSYLRVWTINWRQVDFRVEKSRCNCVFQRIRLRDWL